MTLIRRHLYALSQWTLFGAAVAVAVVTFRAEDWSSWPLIALLAALVVISERLAISVRELVVSGSFVSLTLAMTLLGPGPALAIGLVAAAVDVVAVRDLLPVERLSNLATDATFLVAGGLLARLLVGDVHNPTNHNAHGAYFALVVFAVFLAANALNFALVAVKLRVTRGYGILARTRDVFMPMLPSQLAAAALAAILAIAYTHFHYEVLLGLVLILVIFQYLALALLRSEERGDQLHARSQRLAAMQLGVLSALMETLQMRDPTTARHAVAVSRYARDLATELGCSETEQDQAHSAGLLHDVGKFAWPDRVLNSHTLDPADVSLIRRHPQDGASIVGRLDGYGPIAEAILHHHERVDGTGYPAGLIGREIPLLSRVVAVCETYDMLTSAYSYREPLSPQDALDELRRVSGTQLDGELVEAFEKMLLRDGPVARSNSASLDFDTELDFERRARALAEPALARR